MSLPKKVWGHAEENLDDSCKVEEITTPRRKEDSSIIDDDGIIAQESAEKVQPNIHLFCLVSHR